MKKLIGFFVVFFVVLSCSEEQELPLADVYQIQNLGTLATTEYTFGKILQLDDDKEWFKLGDRKILISVRARAKAGVDLRKINEGDLIVDQATIQIKLPPAEIVSFVMNPEEIRTEMFDVNGFRLEFSQNEKLKVLKMGEERIREEMLESNILRDAERNAKIFLTDFYKDLGYEKVVITFKTNL